MQATFKKATRHLAPDDIVTSHVGPFVAFEPAGFLKEFYDRLVHHQEGQGIAIESGFTFGGAFADLGTGRKPKDHDIYIASPEMVKALKTYFANRDMFDEFSNEGEWLEQALGDNFPISPHADDVRLMHSDTLGDYFEFNGASHVGGAYRKIDIKIGTNNVEPADFITFFSAPIMAAAMTLGEETPRFAYHRDCASHAMRGILCTERPNAPDLIEKAKRKGLEIITPAQLAERDAQQEREYKPVAAPKAQPHIS